MSTRAPFFAALAAATVAGGFSAAIASPPAVEEQLLGFSAEASRAELRREQEFDGLISKTELRAWLEHLAARPHHVGSEWGRANAEWMRDLFASWGYEARIESFDVLFPTPKLRSLEMVAPDPLPRPARRSRARRGRDLGAEEGAAADLQRLLDRRRRRGRAGLRQLRPAAGLRGARAARHRRPRQDRARALRRLLARHQAEGRGGARRHRLPDLLGPGRATATPRATPGRRAAGARATRCSAARWPTCRSTRAIRSPPGSAPRTRPSACRSPRRDILTKIPVLPISAADAQPLLAALAGPMAPAALARRAAARLPPGPGPGPGPSEARVRLEPRSRCTTSSRCCPAASCPTSGSCAAITTTPG